MKSDNLEIEHRVQQVITLIVEAATTSEIVQYCTVKFNVKDRQAYVYINKAKELLNVSNESLKTYQRGLAMQRLTAIFKKALASNNLRIAISAQQEINKITGVYKEYDLSKLSEQERKELIDHAIKNLK